MPQDVANCIATLPRIALLASSVGIELLFSSAIITSVESVKCLGLSELYLTHRSTPCLPVSDKNFQKTIGKVLLMTPADIVLRWTTLTTVCGNVNFM